MPVNDRGQAIDPPIAFAIRALIEGLEIDDGGNRVLTPEIMDQIRRMAQFHWELP